MLPVVRIEIRVSIPERVLEALKLYRNSRVIFQSASVSIPERVLEALKPGNIPADLSLLDVSIPERVLEALKH